MKQEEKQIQPDEDGYVSTNDFAASLGCAPSTVRKAISEGRITEVNLRRAKGKAKRVSGILLEEGKKEWARNYSMGNNHESPVADALAELHEKAMEATPNLQTRDLNESKRITEYYKAELSRIEFEEKEGTLVPLVSIKEQLFQFATEVRVELQNVPAKCVDNVMMEDDRGRKEAVMLAEINNALRKLTEVVERDFT